MGNNEHLLGGVVMPPVLCAILEGDRRHTEGWGVVIRNEVLGEHVTDEDLAGVACGGATILSKSLHVVPPMFQHSIV